jgi:hypothetical protein
MSPQKRRQGAKGSPRGSVPSRPPKRDRRRATTTLAQDMPPGPEGQPGHKAGAEVTLSMVVEWPGLGRLSVVAPRGSSLLLHSARERLGRAQRLSSALESQTSTEGFFRPFADRRVTNAAMFFDLLQELMASIVLMHAALDSFASEEIPEDFIYVDERGREQGRDELLARGIELRLSRVLATATGKENIRTAKAGTWERLEELKILRDSVAHGLGPRFILAQAAADNIYSRLAAADLADLLAAVEETMEHYNPSQPSDGDGAIMNP